MNQKRFYTAPDLKERNSALYEQFKGNDGAELYRKAAENGMNVTTYLEEITPSDDADSIDAFDRLMLQNGIRTKSQPEKGLNSTTVEQMLQPVQKNFYLSNQPASIVLFPEFVNRTMRMARFVQDNLGDLLAARTGITGDTYRSIYVDMTDKTRFKLRRVAESAEIPAVTLKTKENSITLYKYGIVMNATYEVLRRMTLDQLTIHLQAVGMQTNLDKMAQLTDVIINGDGNTNSATNYNLTTLDSAAVAGTPTYKAWISFLTKIYPYQVNRVVGNVATLTKIVTMTFPGIDPMLLLTRFAGETGTGLDVQLQEGVFTSIKLVIDPSMPNDVLIGMDNRFAVEEVFEIGADITETDRIISRQIDKIALSEVTGYAKLYTEASATFTISA